MIIEMKELDFQLSTNNQNGRHLATSYSLSFLPAYFSKKCALTTVTGGVVMVDSISNIVLLYVGF